MTTQPELPLPLEIRQTQQAMHCDHAALNSTHLYQLTQTHCESRWHRAEMLLSGSGEKKITVLRILFLSSTFLDLTFLSYSCLLVLSLHFCLQQTRFLKNQTFLHGQPKTGTEDTCYSSSWCKVTLQEVLYVCISIVLKWKQTTHPQLFQEVLLLAPLSHTTGLLSVLVGMTNNTEQKREFIHLFRL